MSYSPLPTDEVIARCLLASNFLMDTIVHLNNELQQLKAGTIVAKLEEQILYLKAENEALVDQLSQRAAAPSPSGKYYAVRVGRVPGIYMTWEDCKEQTNGYSHATFKAFKTIAAAKAYLADLQPASPNSEDEQPINSTPVRPKVAGRFIDLQGTPLRQKLSEAAQTREAAYNPQSTPLAARRGRPDMDDLTLRFSKMNE